LMSCALVALDRARDPVAEDNAEEIRTRLCAIARDFELGSFEILQPKPDNAAMRRGHAGLGTTLRSALPMPRVSHYLARFQIVPSPWLIQ
jgi:hypothetical protein